MINIKRSIATGWGKGSLYDILKELQLLGVGIPGIQGDIFFVDAQKGYDGNDGKSWDKAFKTIAAAATVSNVIIAQSGKGEWRNTIFCRGRFAETITNFGEKVDLIGVGSLDAMDRPRLTGTHTLAAIIGNSTRFINWEFRPDSASPIFTFTDCYGIEFHNCIFTNTEGFNTTHAIVFTGTACHEIVIADCIFRNDTAQDPFETAAIHHNCTYGFGFIVRDCLISGDIGIDVDTPTIWQGGWIVNNVIQAETFCIDDESDDILCINNRCVSAVDNTTNNDGILDWNVALAAGNIVTGSNHTDNAPALAE